MVRPRNFSRCYVKCIAVLLLALGMLFAACPAYCNDYYVSTTGSDTTGDGSIGNPWKTIPQAVSVVVPGDTIYLRGGTHGYTSTISITTNGTSENPITLRAYQDEAVIVDFTGQPYGSSSRGISLKGSYWHLKGFTIQYAGDNGLYIAGSYNIAEQIVSRMNSDSGIQLHEGGSYNLVLNCDSYLNYDAPNHGENADGFAVKSDAIGPGNMFSGCRSWNNADDGFDLYYSQTAITFEDCWSFRNGENLWGASLWNGDGNGFKLGVSRGNHVLIRCVAYDNWHNGIDINGDTLPVYVYNCTVVACGVNFYFDEHIPSVLRNNISYQSSVNIYDEVDDQYNSWNSGFSVSDSDFVSLDPTGIDGPRQANGNLPDLDFLRLAESSPLIDAGIDVGEPFAGAAPDLGAFEYGYLAASIFVDQAATGANNGATWTDAYNYLQDALDSAGHGAQIWVAEGTYNPDANSAIPGGSGDRTATFQLISGVEVYGGFPAGGSQWKDRDQKVYPTILSGDLNGDDGTDFAGNGENSYHVVTGSGTDKLALLDGFTITAGNANGSYPHNSGGGMYNYSGSPIVNNCIFSGNSADAGGGMYNDQSSPTLTNCTFGTNSTVDSGGGVYNENYSSPMLTNCIFSGNSAEYSGGGMFNYDNANPSVTNCLFFGNFAEYGGGVLNIDNSSTLTNCILWDNTAPNGPQIYNEANSIIVSYSDIQGGWPGTDNIDTDPLFLDPAGSDFHLLQDSPCINAGDNTAVPAGVATDFDGNPRIRGPAVDMGIYESPAVIFVDANAAGANDGSSWENAYNYLQDALNVGWQVDEIRVADGVYKPDEDTAHPDGSGSRTATFQLKRGLALYGGYAGDGEPDPDVRDIELYKTILSGDLNGDDNPEFANNGENSYHVVTGSETDKTALLDGFTITAGNANADYPNMWGGGMLNEGGSPTVVNCTFVQNSSQGTDFGFGGGMLNSQSSPMLTNCAFIGNRATHYGGGILNYLQSNPKITNCIFIGNSTQHPTDSIGGAMFNLYDSSPIVTNTAFIDNSSMFGAALCNLENANPAVTNCTFVGNSAESAGGGVCNLNSSPTMTNCILWDNTAPASGPQIYNEGASPTVSYSDIQGGWPGTGNIDADPLFVNPANNDFHLSPDSPCIDAGDNTAVPAEITTDLEGNTRFADNPGVADTGNGTAPIVDMGAYEFNSRPIADAGPNQVAYAWIDGIAEVILDGSASYDDDGQELTYLWTWSIDGNTYDTNGLAPTIELPVGEHTIELVVNDGSEDSEPNEVMITVVEPTKGLLRVTPRIINKQCGQKRIMAILRLPADIGRQDIDTNMKLLLYPGQIEADYQYVIKYHSRKASRVAIIASFDASVLIDAVGTAGTVQIDVVGQLKTGQYFYGADTVKIISPPRRPPWRWWGWFHKPRWNCPPVK